MSVSGGLRVGAVGLVVAAASVLLAAGLPLLGDVSVASATACPNEEFRIGPSAALPDCRAYELVSPTDKNGGQIDGGINDYMLVPMEQAAASGEAVTFASATAFPGADPLSAMVATQYVSRRTEDGWVTRAVTPTQQVPEGKINTESGAPGFSLFQGFGEELQDGFLLAWTPQPDPSAPAGFYNPYLWEAGTGAYRLLSSMVPPDHVPNETQISEGGPGYDITYAGMSADGKHVIFEANDALTPEAVPGKVNLYEWSAEGGLELVSVLPDGSVDTLGGNTPNEWGNGNAFNRMKFGAPMESGLWPYDFIGAISSDGSRVFWAGGGENYQIYMRETGIAGPRTIEVSASQRAGEPGGGAPSEFWAASREGSRVYFTSSQKLTEDATAGGGEEDLYQYDVDTGALTDLTVDAHEGEGAGVLGVLGAGEGEEGAYVYFAARGVLASGASADAENLYVWHEGQQHLEFIATLGGARAETTDFALPVMERTSRVSPNGRFLAFQSELPLTGYDNTPADGKPCPTPTREGTENIYRLAGGRCFEVYEYDALTGHLTCASCKSDGLPPTGYSIVPESLHQLGDVYGWQSSTVQQRYLLDDGRLFFTSEDALLPEATNARQNVYEYEPEGTGGCAANGAADAAVGGCLYLLSTGASSGNSYFADASADGRDVFLLTSEQLVRQDGDEAIDMYDAREDGGFSPAVPPPCSGEACKPALTPAPAIYGAPSSATFQGAGNTTGAAPTTTTTRKKHQGKGKHRQRKRPVNRPGKHGRAGAHVRHARAGARWRAARDTAPVRRREGGRD